MKLGVALRLMGRGSEPATVLHCARMAEEAGLDDLWVPDHVAIPPDDAEGSDGRYLDALASLAWLAGRTERIGLGTGVLVLPYRRPLPTARQVATIQTLSDGRLRLGVGVGWMQAEFTALGLARSDRGRATDRTLDLLRRCFDADDDVVVENGQPFLFRPHPPAPPIYVGGAAPHALERAVRYGDGWMPMGSDPEKLAPAIAELRERAEAAGRDAVPEVIGLGGLPAGEPGRAAERLARLGEIGVTGFVAGGRYTDAAGFARLVDGLVAARDALGAAGQAAPTDPSPSAPRASR